MHDDEDDPSTINKEEYDNFVEELEFEQNFYRILAGTEKFEIVSIPDPDGTVFTPEHLKIISDQCKRHDMAILYRVSNGKFAVIYSPANQKFAIVPEGDKDGYEC